MLFVICLTWTVSRLVKYWLLAKNIETDKTREQLQEEERKKRLDELYGR